jgi:hypothetical protein
MEKHVESVYNGNQLEPITVQYAELVFTRWIIIGIF